jgi:hypothetical protein
MVKEKASQEKLIYTGVKIKFFSESYSSLMSLVFQVNAWSPECEMPAIPL